MRMSATTSTPRPTGPPPSTGSTTKPPPRAEEPPRPFPLEYGEIWKISRTNTDAPAPPLQRPRILWLHRLPAGTASRERAHVGAHAPAIREGRPVRLCPVHQPPPDPGRRPRLQARRDRPGRRRRRSPIHRRTDHPPVRPRLLSSAPAPRRLQ